MSILLQIDKIRQEIPPDVRLIAVTKQVDVSAMREAYAAGIRDFGESRLQEAIPKQKILKDLHDVQWHFIGHLQANKAQKALAHFDWIQSVDSLKLAQRLNSLAQEFSRPPRVCLQVKIRPDPNKYGWEVSEVIAALSELESLQNLNIAGLMTILPLGLNETQILDAFQSTQELAQKIQLRSHLVMRELSMGMSGDYLAAVQSGATMIRLGRIIFGSRSEDNVLSKNRFLEKSENPDNLVTETSPLPPMP